MKSYEIYKERRLRLHGFLRLLKAAEEEADRSAQKAIFAREELDWFKDALFGDCNIEHRIARRDLKIDDRLCGEMPCVGIRFKRCGFVCGDYRNPSLYSCELVLPKNAVFTPAQGRLLFNTIREVLEFATKGANE